MEWSEGHIWKLVCQKSKVPDVFEYKFVLRDAHNGLKVVRWEGGKENHKFAFNEYIKQFSQPAILEALKDGGSAGGVVNMTFPNS